MKLRQLKVKIKSLAEEQRIIKHEERKALKSDMWTWRQHMGEQPYAPHYLMKCYDDCIDYYSLCEHRMHTVRPEIRSALIAYGLLRGKKLEQIEPPRTDKQLARKPYREPDWQRIDALLKKYGGRSVTRESLKIAA